MGSTSGIGNRVLQTAVKMFSAIYLFIFFPWPTLLTNLLEHPAVSKAFTANLSGSSYIPGGMRGRCRPSKCIFVDWTKYYKNNLSRADKCLKKLAMVHEPLDFIAGSVLQRLHRLVLFVIGIWMKYADILCFNFKNLRFICSESMVQQIQTAESHGSVLFGSLLVVPIMIQ